MRNGSTRTIGGKILRPVKAGYGYWTVQLGAGNKEYVHRLVAKAFLGDRGSGYEVNHKDENPNNNHLDNLEWLTKKENLDYGSRTKRSGIAAAKKAKSIVAIKDGKPVTIYKSLHDAAKAGFSRYHVGQCCLGKEKQHKGFEWKYTDTQKEAAPSVDGTESGKAES